MGILVKNYDQTRLYGNEVEKYYLTFEALEDGTISFNIWYSMGTDYITSISYSVDDGKTWVKTENTDNKEENLVIDVDVKKGDKILWKGEAAQTGFYDEDEGDAVGSFFSSDCEFNVYGNIMSLLYEDDFRNKTSLNNIDYIFNSLFYDYYEDNSCKVVSAEYLVLSALELTEHCYENMFTNCTSLTTPPVLSATTLADYCYSGMFFGCTSLTTAPVLPATTLASNCYSAMFYDCTSLTTAPELPATILTPSCYQSMLRSCINLNYIKMLATDVSAEFCLYNWASLVAEEGTLIVNKDYEGSRSDLNIPNGWTVLNEDGTEHIFPSTPSDYSKEYLTFEVLENGTFTLNIPAAIAGITDNIESVYYKINNGDWVNNTVDHDTTITVNVSKNDKVYWKSTANQLGNSNSTSQFSSTCNYNVSGNIMSLLNGDNFQGVKSFANSSKFNFKQLFYNSTKLISAENLILPVLSLTESCYNSMFRGCTSLTTSPKIYAQSILMYSCLANMFNGCSNLNYVVFYYDGVCPYPDIEDQYYSDQVEYSNISTMLENVAATGTFVVSEDINATAEQYFEDQVVPSGWTLEHYVKPLLYTLYVDKFPTDSDEYWESDYATREEYIEAEVAAAGTGYEADWLMDIYEYYGDTLEYDGDTYYVCDGKVDSNVESMQLLLSTDDYNTLLNDSIAESGANTQFNSLVYVFSYGDEYDDNTDSNRQLLKIINNESQGD